MEGTVGDRVSALTDRRTALHEALSGVFDAPVGGYAFAGRVLPHRPAKAVAPLVWLDDSTSARQRDNLAQKWVATFPAWVTFDGADAAQVAGIEEIIGRIYDAAAAKFTVMGHAPSPLPPELVDSAPARLRASVVTITAAVRADTFCPPTDTA